MCIDREGRKNFFGFPGPGDLNFFGPRKKINAHDDLAS